MGDTPQQAPPEQTPPSSSPPPSSGGSGGLDDNIAGALAYLFIPAIIWLVVEPYKSNKFIRFHSFQALFLTAANIVLSILVPIFAIALRRVPGGSTVLYIFYFLPLIVLVLAVFCMYKAYSKEEWKIPFIGDFAEKQANG